MNHNGYELQFGIDSSGADPRSIPEACESFCAQAHSTIDTSDVELENSFQHQLGTLPEKPRIILDSKKYCEVIDMELAGHAINMDGAKAVSRAVVEFFAKNINLRK